RTAPSGHRFPQEQMRRDAAARRDQVGRLVRQIAVADCRVGRAGGADACTEGEEGRYETDAHGDGPGHWSKSFLDARSIAEAELAVVGVVDRSVAVVVEQRLVAGVAA